MTLDQAANIRQHLKTIHLFIKDGYVHKNMGEVYASAPYCHISTSTFVITLVKHKEEDVVISFNIASEYSEKVLKMVAKCIIN